MSRGKFNFYFTFLFGLVLICIYVTISLYSFLELSPTSCFFWLCIGLIWFYFVNWNQQIEVKKNPMVTSLSLTTVFCEFKKNQNINPFKIILYNSQKLSYVLYFAHIEISRNVELCNSWHVYMLHVIYLTWKLSWSPCIGQIFMIYKI